MRAAVLLLSGLTLLGLVGCGGGDEPTRPRVQPVSAQARPVPGAPPPLAALQRQAGQLLPGGAGAFAKRIDGLAGYPVVVNKWASWCGPCATELPVFNEVSRELGKDVAFVGVNSMDSEAAARRFLARNPVNFPSYSDPDQDVAKLFRGNAAFPTTAFYDRRGRFVIALQTFYSRPDALRRDVERYTR